MTQPLSLKFCDWPPEDKARWIAARKPAGFLDKPRPASKWSARRCRIVEQAYGQWLAWLLSGGEALDAHVLPQDRVIEARVDEFVEVLQARVSSASVGMMIGAFYRMMCVLAPASDWQWLRQKTQILKSIARPERNRLAHLTTPKQLYDLGIGLMRRSRGTGEDTYHAVTMGRDGLIIAMLICCPVRIKNLCELGIGVHLRFDVDRYWIALGEHETKTGRTYQGEYPPELTEWIDWYLKGPRERLLSHGAGCATRRLWINRFGKEMDESAIREQIKKRTRVAFGRHVWPHLFRPISVTGLIDQNPEQIAIGPDLLGHTNEQTMQKHYILARGNQAHRAVQRTLLEARAEAIARLRGGVVDDTDK